ncbi:MAG TPA: TlpA disulfide reductase family protein [Candidatus Eremiobacteraceae bacterium]|nr:TlpA disulfide reductase family protein [Candidatus Eremiobacteraceae bacterium]
MTRNRALHALIVSLAVCAPMRALADVHLAVGQPAPAISLEMLSGKKLSLTQFKGKPVYVNFFASWCQPCKQELPYIVKQYPALKASTVFLGVDELEAPAQIAPFAKQMGITYPILIDPGSVGAEYQIDTLPKSVFIDRHGVVRAVWRGFIPPAIFKKSMDLIAAS